MKGDTKMRTQYAGTEYANVVIPTAMLAQAREMWPELRNVSKGKILRFALAYALTNDTDRAIAATRDTRIGTKRTQKTE